MSLRENCDYLCLFFVFLSILYIVFFIAGLLFVLFIAGLLFVLVHKIYLAVSGIAYFTTSPEDPVRMAAEQGARGRGSSVVGNDDDDEKEEEKGEQRQEHDLEKQRQESDLEKQRQESDLEKQPLLAREDRPWERWEMSDVSDLSLLWNAPGLL